MEEEGQQNRTEQMEQKKERKETGSVSLPSLLWHQLEKLHSPLLFSFSLTHAPFKFGAFRSYSIRDVRTYLRTYYTN